MVEPFRDIDPARVAANVAEVRAELPPGAELLVACKYVPSEEMAALAEAGVVLVGENRLADLEEKQRQWGHRFEWDFIGNLQSRKVKDVLPLVRLIHSVHSDSVLKQLAIHGDDDTEVLIQVNVAGEEGKGGVAPKNLGAAIERCPVRVVGLSTMPPFTDDPEDSRPHFARLAELGAEHGLERLSMGTSQDWRIALDEGATTIRLGSILFG
jgi:PLP dependent protein